MTEELFTDAPFLGEVVSKSLAGDSWESDRTARFFSKRRPSEVTVDAFEREFPGDWASSHYLLTDEAYLHFLPALLQIAEEARSGTSSTLSYASMLGESLRTTFARMARGELAERLNVLMNAYSGAQISRIADFFLDEVRWEGSEEFEGNREGLVFWGKFASRDR